MDSPRPATIPTHGVLRVLRGSCVGAAAVAVAATGHVAGGGALPAPLLLVGLTAPSAAVAWWCSDRRWTGARLVGVLLGIQGLLHLDDAFSLRIVGGVLPAPVPLMPRPSSTPTAAPLLPSLHLRSTPWRRGPPLIVAHP